MHGQSVYYDRHIFRDGEDLGIWSDYAKLWPNDWKRIQRGDFHLFRGGVIIGTAP
jgi:hypothetical protein